MSATSTNSSASADNEARLSRRVFAFLGLVFSRKVAGHARRESARASGHAAEILLIRRESCDFSPEFQARATFAR